MSEMKQGSNPIQVGLKLVAAIFVTELLIMLAFTVLHVSSFASPIQVDLADAVLLSILSSLLILYWIVKPMKIAEEKLAQRTMELERTSEDLEKRHTEISILFRVSSVISRTLHMRELVSAILDTISELEVFAVDKGGIFLIKDGKMILVSHLGHTDEFLSAHKDLKVGDCLCGHAAKTGEIIICPNVAQDKRHTIPVADSEAHAHIIVPLKARDNIVGVLYLYFLPGAEMIDGEKVKLLQSIGNQIGVALENSKLYHEAEELSLHDPLTGLANRRLLEVSLERSIALAKRSHGPLSAIMADIDYFKRYNDVHGHDAGDRLLSDIAAAILHEVREADLVVRYGGEEFFILMPGTAANRAMEVAERIRKEIEAKTGVTISLGVTAFREGMRKEELIKNADAALYQAKHKGRNRIEAAA